MGGPHLHVLVHKVQRDDVWLLVPISSVKPNRYVDRACILEAGEHPYLTHQSYAAYIKMYEVRTMHIMAMVTKGSYFSKAPFTKSIFDRLVNGLFASDEVSLRRVAELKRSGLSPI